MAGWVGLIHRQRQRRIDCEVEKLRGRLVELHATDPGRYYEGDWTEAFDGLIFWLNRDPHDESQWIATVTP